MRVLTGSRLLLASFEILPVWIQDTLSVYKQLKNIAFHKITTKELNFVLVDFISVVTMFLLFAHK